MGCNRKATNFLQLKAAKDLQRRKWFIDLLLKVSPLTCDLRNGKIKVCFDRFSEKIRWFYDFELDWMWTCEKAILKKQIVKKKKLKSQQNIGKSFTNWRNRKKYSYIFTKNRSNFNKNIKESQVLTRKINKSSLETFFTGLNSGVFSQVLTKNPS